MHDYYRTFDNALRSRDAVVLRENEAMLYKPVESSLLATMEDFRRLTQNSVAKFTLVYGRELFDAASEQEFEQVRRRPGYAVTLKDDEGLRGTPGSPQGNPCVGTSQMRVFHAAYRAGGKRPKASGGARFYTAERPAPCW